jgi:hypothetical protein
VSNDHNGGGCFEIFAKVFVGAVIFVVVAFFAIVFYLGYWYSGDWSEHVSSSDSGSAPAAAASVDAADTIQPGDGGEKGLDVRLLNYTDDNLGSTYVNDVSVGGMSKHGGGTSTAGGVAVPQKWRKDFELRISWQNDAMFEKKVRAERMVPIEPYRESDGGSLWVAFLPGDVVRLYVSGNFPGNPDFPAKMAMPFVQCWYDGFKDCQESGRPDGWSSKAEEIHDKGSP